MNELRENSPVQVRFLLGPAGTGKTHRCLEEVRAELASNPEGAPLLFIAPKQATFQIERHLLADPALGGYTRLQILSFERLAEFVLDALGGAPREILSEEGRVMILRALLAARSSELKTFHATARLPGFAQQLAALLRELQHQQIAPERLRLAGTEEQLPRALRDKLHDLALLHGAYRDWLRAGGLEDADSFLDVATSALLEARQPWAHGLQLWMDGFAEMTPQELNLLAAVLPCCEKATLAFCLEGDFRLEELPRLSLWTVVGQTYRAVRQRVDSLDGVEVAIEALPRRPERNRFARAPRLAALEARWAAGTAPVEPESSFPGDASELRLVTCANVEAEAICAAREIHRFVREGRGRFRDCAVLMRTLTGYHDIVRRVFHRFDLPIFLDRREPITHHPLAELTRFALRLVAYGWRSEDWFGALKTGLVELEESFVDRLENAALQGGWEREQWLQGLPARDGQPNSFEPRRAELVAPFEALIGHLTGPITGRRLAQALRQLWSSLEVEATLERWSVEVRSVAPLAGEVHETVPEQIFSWLDNVERAFAEQALSLPEWLPILESGLAGLKVGVIPPALDQVLVGTIDRSRNPDLRLVVVIGLNETVFPAPPPPPPLLTEREREAFSGALAREKRTFGLSQRDRLAHERYYGYIACTRSRERLLLTWSAADARGRLLNPSPFITQLLHQLPGLTVESFSPSVEPAAVEHTHELASAVLKTALAGDASDAGRELASWPEFAGLIARARDLQASAAIRTLNPELAGRLYPSPYRSSVSRLENFAACPFKFFVGAGLGVREREEFEVDARKQGDFQHAILQEFHRRATLHERRWRDWSPAEAARLIQEIGAEYLSTHQAGLFAKGADRRFAAEILIGNLAELASTLVGWMEHYQFDPRAVELSFGLKDSPWPGWKLDLGEGRELLLGGRVDRIDFCASPDQGRLAVVIDYKSSARKLDNTKLHHGLDLQLLSYLGWLRQVDPGQFGGERLIPAGVFYVALRGSAKSAASREEAGAEAELTRRKAFQHAGRFDATWKPQLDAEGQSGQFNMRGRSDPCPPEVFQELVAMVENHLRRFGQRILGGEMEVSPYQKGQEVACDRCEFQAVCRFDPWTRPYRQLPPPPKTSSPVKPARKARKA